MALTYRGQLDRPLTSTEIDANFAHFTGSHSITGSLIVTEGITSNGNQVISGSILISGSIIPAADNSATSSFSLGSITNAWKDIFVSNGTINFIDSEGNIQAALSSTTEGLAISGALIVTEIVPQSGSTGSFTGSLEGTASYALTASYAENGGGGVNTGDITFEDIKIIGAGTGSGDGNEYSTIELVPDNNLYDNDQYLILDPTAPNHIHVRAGGEIDNSNAYLYLGGEKNHVRVNDSGPTVRLQTTSNITLNTYYFNVGNTYSTAVWETVGDVNQITINNPSQSIYDAVGAFNNVSVFSVVDNVSNPVLEILNSSTPGGPNPIVLTVNLAPPSNPTNLDQLYFEINQARETYIQTDGTDIRMEAADDIRIYSNDIFRLANYSVEDGIEIITSYDNTEHEWYFGVDGILSVPGDIIGANNLATTSSNTFVGNQIISGSLTTTDYVSSAGGFTGSLLGTSSWAENALTASYLPTATYQVTASWAESASNAINAQTASFLPVATYNITSSWAKNALTASRAILATQSAIPVGAGVEGEIIPVNDSGTYYLYMFIGGTWRSASFA